MPRVGFSANNGTMLELIGYRIKNVEFIPEQEMSSIESTRTIIDPNDGITVMGIEKNIVNTVTIKLIPRVDDKNAFQVGKAKKIHVEEPPGNSGAVGKRSKEKEEVSKEN